MKRKPFLLILTALLMFSACEKVETPSSDISQSEENSSSELTSSESVSESKTSSEQESSSSVSENPNEPEPIHTLDTPVVSFDKETGLAYWQEVEYADSYNIVINSGEVINSIFTNLPLDDYSNISVQAINDYTKSDWSKVVTNYTTEVVEYVDDADIKVYFHDSNIATQTLNPGERVNKPNNPSKEHYIFDGFYSDPYFSETFDFESLIYEDTIIYMKWIKQDYIDTSFWVKASPKISSPKISSNASSSGWRFIPLTSSVIDENVIYSTVITVSGASSSDPAYFIIMDGFTDGGLRNYWKNGDNEDFSITSDGTYKITFSLDTLYGDANKPTHAKYETYNVSNSTDLGNGFGLNSPVLTVDKETNKVSWLEVMNATKYEYVVNNGNIQETTNLSVALAKGSHISLRAVNDTFVSKWSIPAGNVKVNYEQVEDENLVSYYFADSGEYSKTVEKGYWIESAPSVNKTGYTFDGWYIDIARTTKAVFPYQLNKDTIFYPKFINKFVTGVDFKIVDLSGNKIADLKLNEDNYDFIEYETESFKLSAETQIKIVSNLDSNNVYGPYTIQKGTYIIYFSEEKLWDIDTENERNIYVATVENTYYFSNNYRWDKVYSYHWSDDGDWYHSWPGHQMVYVKTNDYGEDIFKVTLDSNTYCNAIFNNNNNAQTVDIKLSNYPSGTGFYISGGSGSNYTVGTYTYN